MTRWTEDFNSPAKRAFSITPHDSNNLTMDTRAVWVGSAGNLEVLLVDDTSAVVLVGVPAGTLLPLRCRRVRANSTTAGSIVGLA